MPIGTPLGYELYADLKPFPEDLENVAGVVISGLKSRVALHWSTWSMPTSGRCRRTFVAAHGNSIRAILKYLKDIAGDVIPGLEIQVAIPLVYGLDAGLKPIPNEYSSRLMAIPSVPS